MFICIFLVTVAFYLGIAQNVYFVNFLDSTPMITKIIVIAALLAILTSLGFALKSIVKDKDNPKRMAKALTTRITLSVLLFIFLLLAFTTGLIKPHGLNPNFTAKEQVKQAN